MWKAIIKLIEKWAYRCDHEWYKEDTTEVFSSYKKEKGDLPTRIIRTYVCKKCMSKKTLGK